MSLICGDFGGINASGQPCGKPAGSGTTRKGFGPCKDHSNLGLPKLAEPRKHAFLVAYAITGNVSRSAAAAGCDRGQHYDWLKVDENYKAAFEHAKAIAGEALEMEARRRAVHGTEKPVFYEGRQVSVIREYSDVLLIFLLKGAMPEKYREKYDVTHLGKDGSSLSVRVIHEVIDPRASS